MKKRELRDRLKISHFKLPTTCIKFEVLAISPNARKKYDSRHYVIWTETVEVIRLIDIIGKEWRWAIARIR